MAVPEEEMKAGIIMVAMSQILALGAQEVSFKEDSITLPTYAPGGYDKNPLFYTGRVYQGAQGRVYPYPMQDVLHDEKFDETYKYLTLENKWLQMGLLPEHGGHLLNLTDKQTGFETFYRQHVIKPALIGMLGAWISGGVEWNFPHHHRATTAMPIDWRHVANADGSQTVWIGETELRRRLKWTIGLSLLPDRAVLQAENVFMNRQPWIETMIYWANVSVHCGDDYQILFPPSMHLGFDHHKNYWTSYPIGPRKEETELLPSQRSKYADDISGQMDLSWWKNFTIESRSIFGMDPDNAWLAGYDHKKQCGTAHVSNRHITVGKKFFLWGNFPEAHVWDKVLTDNDGPYLELMVGCWSDNQPDYSWIAPYETRKVEQFWFPVKGIGGVKNVTIDGAVNVDRVKKDELLVGFHSTRVLKGCTVTVYKGKEAVFTENTIAIDPNTPWCKTVKVDADAKDQQFTAALADADGNVFLSYTPVPEDPHDPLPPKVANPKPPKEYASAELAYLVGLRLDQFHNGLVDPVPYYARALEIDPDYSRANVAMGVRLAKNGCYAEAKPYLEKAVARATQNYTRALDAAPEYYLAIVERGLGNLKRAEDLFWRCTWRATCKKESYVEIARLAALRGDWAEALARIDDALALGQDEAKLWTMKGLFLRKLGQAKAARACFKKALACDPLEYWAVALRGGLKAAEKNRGLKAQQLLEAVCDCWGVGAWDEVVALCDAALAKAAAEKPYRTDGALPLKETIAAGMILEAISTLHIIHHQSSIINYPLSITLIDPMAGSGTFSLEAAYQANDLIPGLCRDFALKHQPAFKEATWKFITSHEPPASRLFQFVNIVTSDISGKAVEIIRHNVECSPLATVAPSGPAPVLDPQIRDFFSYTAAEIADAASSSSQPVILLNPPYGKRLDFDASRLYTHIGRRLAELARDLAPFNKALTVAILAPKDDTRPGSRYTCTANLLRECPALDPDKNTEAKSIATSHGGFALNAIIARI